MSQQKINPKIIIYDTTLRDGTQREGLSLSVADKLRIADRLEQLGVAFIEGGWAGANPKDDLFFQQMGARSHSEKPNKTELVVFCSTRRAGIQAKEDPMLIPILGAKTSWVTIFGKSWDLHVIEGLRTSLDENLAMINDTVTYLKSQNRRVLYDAEHWFDGYQKNPDYALQTLKSAFSAGAEWFVLCDTNGGTLPDQVGKITQIVYDQLRQWGCESPQIGIHTHNDAGLAVANAIAAVQHGATMVQGTINGYGERCGNANLCTVIPNLQLKMGYDCIANPTQLTQVSRQVSEIVNLAPDDHAPFVGSSAFAHKGGIHVSAVQRNPFTYEHIAPESIGNLRRIVISEQAGLSNVISKVETFGICLRKEDSACRQILQKTKELEKIGYQFESAEASFELLVREALGDRPQFFAISNFYVYCHTDTHRTDGMVNSQATVKVIVKGEEYLTAAEGNGPVAALDRALRKALINFYPEIANFYLTDYKVRILNSDSGTQATTRVLIEFSNGQRRWSTAGVSDNIIDASCKALGEGLEYGLLSEVRYVGHNTNV
ncbi:MAG: citramalate synthase [Oscillatoriales cyanobacterium CG2_30_44_21]|nr:MAG: citramalate synthase [Oscillatoriales cyanobacterium CG2_30_44_21]